MHQPLPGDHRGRTRWRRRGPSRSAGPEAAQPSPDRGRPRPVRHQPGAGQEGSGRRQPLQAGSTPATRWTKSSSRSRTSSSSARPARRRSLPDTLARVLDVPFCIADATSLTEAVNVGEDVENILLRLIQAAELHRRPRPAGHHLHLRHRPPARPTTPRSRATCRARVSSRHSQDPGGTTANVPPEGGRKTLTRPCIDRRYGILFHPAAGRSTGSSGSSRSASGATTASSTPLP